MKQNLRKKEDTSEELEDVCNLSNFGIKLTSITFQSIVNNRIPAQFKSFLPTLKVYEWKKTHTVSYFLILLLTALPLAYFLYIEATLSYTDGIA